MKPQSSDLWEVLQARDRAILATKKTFQTWIESLEAQVAGTKDYAAKVEAGIRDYAVKAEAATKEYTAKLEGAIREKQEELNRQGLALHEAESRLRALEETHQGTKEYLASVEKDRDERLERIQATQALVDQKGLALHHAESRVREVEQALKGTTDYLEQVDLNRQFIRGQLADAQAQLDDARKELQAIGRPPTHDVQLAFHHYARHWRKAIVAQYHPGLLPYILQLATLGVTVEVFGSPPLMSGDYQGRLHFVRESLWDWLGVIDSLFNERAYLEANPDVAGAVAQGHFGSGREHYWLFGEKERRPLATPYFAGLSEFDAILFDAANSAQVVSCIAGRLRPHQRLAINGCTGAESYLSPDAAAKSLGGNLTLLHRPPDAWLAVAAPTSSHAEDPDWPRRRLKDLYPAVSPLGKPWPKITVVTVSYNQAGFLEETLRSVLDQRYPNLEYLVVDGGSSDGSVEIIKKYADRLTWWVSEKDRGQSEALNKGFRRATGEILTWLNSDDRLAPGSLFTVAHAFLRHECDVIVGRCARLWNSDVLPHHFHRCNLPLGERVPLPLDGLLDLDERWLKGHFFHQPEVFYTKRLFDRAGGSLREDLYYSMDYDLWVRFAQAGATVVSIPEIVAMFRMHAQQKTGGDDLPYLPELRQVNAAHLAALPLAAPRQNLPV